MSARMFEVLPLIAPIARGPTPTPTEIAVRRLDMGGPVVAVQLSDATGVRLLFLAPDDARTVAEQLREAAGAIIIAPAGLIT